MSGTGNEAMVLQHVCNTTYIVRAKATLVPIRLHGAGTMTIMSGTRCGPEW